MAKKKQEKQWKVLNKCYAHGTLYLEGDTVDGGDFSDNDNFEEITNGKEEEADAEGENGANIPPVDAE